MAAPSAAGTGTPSPKYLAWKRFFSPPESCAITGTGWPFPSTASPPPSKVRRKCAAPPHHVTRKPPLPALLDVLPEYSPTKLPKNATFLVT
jgi:hypothetical protein